MQKLQCAARRSTFAVFLSCFDGCYKKNRKASCYRASVGTENAWLSRHFFLFSQTQKHSSLILPTWHCSSIPILIYLPHFSDFCLRRGQQPQPTSPFGVKSCETEFLSKSGLFFYMIEILNCVIVTSSNDLKLFLVQNSHCWHLIWLFRTK